MECPSPSRIVEVMSARGYAVFRDPRGHDLNLVGIRTADMTANRFNDWLAVFYWFDGDWNFFPLHATTDPGTFYRHNPDAVNGTAILKPGQYRRAYRIGRHKTYKALRQDGSVTVYRDANRDDVLDTRDMPEETGVFGIDIHRAHELHASVQVDQWSAGCQVVQDPDQFLFLLTLCDRAAAKYGNSFTYTLLEEADFAG
jgi:hypothetical protein